MQQLTDALLEVEAEKSTWSAKEKAFMEANERLKISNDEIFKLSEDLSKVFLYMSVTLNPGPSILFHSKVKYGKSISLSLLALLSKQGHS